MDINYYAGICQCYSLVITLIFDLWYLHTSQLVDQLVNQQVDQQVDQQVEANRSHLTFVERNTQQIRTCSILLR